MNKSFNSKKIIFIYKQKSPSFFKKNEPNEFLYGFAQLKKVYPCSFLMSKKKGRFLFFNILEKFITLHTKIGFSFSSYFSNKDKFKKDDILFAVNDGIGFGLLFFKLFKKLNNQIIILVQGLHDRYQYFSRNKPLIYLYQKILSCADLILTLSNYEKKLLIKLFKLKEKKVKVFLFGIDIKYWQPDFSFRKNKKEFVLSVGNDMHRDYELLLKNYCLKIPLILVTKSLKGELIRIVKNNPLFINYKNITNSQLKNLYNQAKFVIVPLKKTLATSGLSVILQSLAMKKPVLTAATPALKEFFKDKKNLLYYKINNKNSFKKKLIEINNNEKLRNLMIKNSRHFVKKKFNSNYMSVQILSFLKNFA